MGRKPKSEKISSPPSGQEEIQLTDAEKAKQERLARLALARQKAHQVLKEKREAEKAEKEKLTRENEELKKKVVDKPPADVVSPKPRETEPKATTPDEESETEVIVVKKPKKVAAPKPAPKTKKRIVYVEDSSSEDNVTDSESEEEIVYKKTPKKKNITKQEPKAIYRERVPDPVASMSRAQIMENLRQIQLQSLYEQMWK